MYQTQTTGILELLMNALTLPSGRRASTARVPRVPRRRESATRVSVQDAQARTESYFEAARLSRWTR